MGRQLTPQIGNSGSPVLRQQDLVALGAHVYGGSFNSASVIGKFGNPYQDYVAAFGLPVPNDSLNLIPVTGNTAISAPVPSGYGASIPSSMALTGPAICEICKTRKVEIGNASQVQRNAQAQHASQAPATPGTQARPQRQRSTSTMTKLIQDGRAPQGRRSAGHRQLTAAEEESFIDVLRTVASALPAGLGMIGGGPIGALAGFALNAASKVLAESTGAESAFDEPAAVHEGGMERAILAEATLCALQSAELRPELEESIFSDMKEAVLKALPVVRKAAPRVMGAMMEPALKIALDSLHNYNQKVASGAESFEATPSGTFHSTVLYTSAIDQPADRQAEAFLGHLQASLQQNLQESAMDGELEEGWFDGLGDIFKAGTRLAGQGVLAAAKHGLPILAKVLSGAESFDDQASSDPSAHLLAADPLAQRALVADAALNAIMKLPPQQLQEEGIFDFISDAVKTIAPIAMKVAPMVAGAINPTVGRLMSTVLHQESAAAGESSIPGSIGPVRAAVMPRGPSEKRSLLSLRDGSTRGNERRNRSEQPGANGSSYAPYTRLGTQLGY